MVTIPVPPSLSRHPFTMAQARAAGLSPDVVRGPSYRTLLRGVYVSVDVELTLLVWLRAVLLVVPADAVISHVTALRLYGFDVAEEQPFHVSTRSSTYSRHQRITTHRRLGRITMHRRKGLPVTGPERTVVDVATKVSLVELIQAAEHMIHQGFTTFDRLMEYALDHHLDGVLRTRRVMTLVREGAESPMETLVRLMLVFARLPEPACNAVIRDAAGRFLARGDLVYAHCRLVVEYDGWHHERNAWQRQRDIIRREGLESAGWRVIVVTSGDLTDKPEVVRRVHRALVEQGYTGNTPHLNTMWESWFTTPHDVGT